MVLHSFEKQAYAMGIYVDFSRAFEQLHHKTLLQKLDHYGFHGNFLDLIRTYLWHRKQQQPKTTTAAELIVG